MRRKPIVSLMALFSAALLGMLAGACQPAEQVIATPTFDVGTDTPTPAPSATPSITPTPAPIGIAQLETPTASYTPGTPTDLPSATPSQGPYTYTVQQGDTLVSILPRFGYFDFGVLDEIVRLNNLASADRLPPPGSTLLIPRQTATPIPAGAEMTATILAQVGRDQYGLPLNAIIAQHTVEAGQTLVDIADLYSMSLRQVQVLNPTLNWTGCDFDLPSGGPDCAPIIREGQPINVVAPTPTPTLSPTPSGSETPTPSPTFAAPLAVFPVNGALFPPGVFPLQWVSVGVLGTDDYYFLEIVDVTAGVRFNEALKTTSYLFPASLVPNDGQTHTFEWRVSIARRNADGSYGLVGAVGDWQSFQMQSQ